jgi:outer membrane protein
MRTLLRTLAPCTLLIAAGAAFAQPAPLDDSSADRTPSEDSDGPRWEAGVAAGGGRVADYPGSDRHRVRGLIAPVVIYRGKVLRVDAGGIRGRFFSSPDWTFDLTATGAFNAKSNEARRGMPALDYLFGIGPQLVYTGWQHGGSGPSLHLKSRAMFSTNFRHVDAHGFTLDPELRWRMPLAGAGRTAVTWFVQPTWASRELQRYFYEVSDTQATADRPAYRARAGYLGTEFGATLSGRMDHGVSWFVTGRAMSLSGAANEASPLVKSRLNTSIGAGVMWLFWSHS